MEKFCFEQASYSGRNNMKHKTKPVLDIKKALQEKETMQKHFVREHGYESSVFVLLIEHFKEQLER